MIVITYGFNLSHISSFFRMKQLPTRTPLASPQCRPALVVARVAGSLSVTHAHIRSLSGGRLCWRGGVALSSGGGLVGGGGEFREFALVRVRVRVEVRVGVGVCGWAEGWG